jgi:hypothetical protein
VSQSTCAHQRRVNSRLLVVGSQNASLTSGPSFAHNLCCKCLNGSCKDIFDIYASKPFQRYKEHFKAKCFDPCNRVPKSPFWGCECHPHIPSKWGCDIFGVGMNLNIVILCRCLRWGKSMRRLTSKMHFPTYAGLRLVWLGSSYWYIDLSLSITTLMPSQTPVYRQSIFMANFQCPECNICFAAFHQRDGHHRSVHQSTYKICIAIGRITVRRSIDGKYPCPIDYCKSTFDRSDNL